MLNLHISTTTGTGITALLSYYGGTSADVRVMRTLSSQLGTFSSFYEHVGNIQLRLLNDIRYFPLVTKPNVLSQARQFVRVMLQMSARY
jgi:hypothetical protein